MKRIHFAFFALAAILLASCSDKSDTPQIPVSEIDIEFSLADIAPASRADATWADSYTTASELGGITTVHAYVFDDANCIGKIDATKEGTSTTYSGKLNTEKISTSLNGKTLKLQVLANLKEPEPFDPDKDFATLEHIFGIVPSSSSVPMWGVTICTPEFVSGDASSMGILKANFGEVKMLRSIAKVVVNVTGNDDNDVLNSIKLTGSLTGNSKIVPPYVPAGVSATTSVARYAIDPQTPTASSQSHTFNADAKTNSVSFYLPEQTNQAGEGEIKMLVTINGEEFSTPILFRDYTDGIAGDAPKNIMRNHIYLFNVNVEKGLLSVESQDWAVVINNTFTF